MNAVVIEPNLNIGRQHDTELKCSVCNKTFTRNDHLKRHELSHTKSKPFQCETCGRQFLRKDALSRHSATHGVGYPTLRQQGARACSACAASKVRCSGELPMCSWCKKKGRATCTYPNQISTPNLDGAQDVTREESSIEPQAQMELARSTETQLERSHESMSGSVEAISFQLHHNDWGPDFNSTMNWLFDDTQMFPYGDINFNDIDDAAFFSFVDIPPATDPGLRTNGTQAQVICSPAQTLIESPGISPHAVSNISLSSVNTLTSPQSTSPHTIHTDGALYVDGQPARLPRVKRRRLTTSIPATTPNNIDKFCLNLEGCNIYDDETQIVPGITHQVYQTILLAFSMVCEENTASSIAQGQKGLSEPRISFFAKYEPGFPSKHDLEKLMQSYIVTIQPTLPLFHASAFDKLDWRLVVAICCLGARCLATTMLSPHFALSMQEFLRRLIVLGNEHQSWLPTSVTAWAQIKLLYTIDLAYGSLLPDEEAQAVAGNLPLDFCSTNWSSEIYLKEVEISIQQSDWKQWQEAECKNRLGYAIWLMDCMLAIHCQRRPRLNLDDASSPLPCHESIWDASTYEEWLAAVSKSHPTHNMKTMLHQLYVEKKLPQRCGEFSQVLVIHGLFHRMWEVEAYWAQPLSLWTPTAQPSQTEVVSPDAVTFLPSQPIFARWRNATCDCFDILHWNANAAIGAASGMEHPTVMHLHFSRVVILTPYKEIVALAKYLTMDSIGKSGKSIASHKQTVRRWAIHDQYKARLAMIHAGVLFWHVRRYSVSGYYEPTSVAMAALALWAFSVFSDKSTEPQDDQSFDLRSTDKDDSENEEPRYNLILLDRPTDDELVQQYVREGHRMRTILNGVGDLRGPRGPERVLIEARKLLKTTNIWKVSEYWIDMFEKLISVSRRQREISDAQGRQQPPHG